MIRLVAFLGNPGREYAKTRHNLAWLVADSLPGAASLAWTEKFKGVVAPVAGAGSVILLKPATFMNRSGEAVAAALRFYKFTVDELLVVHDEVELPFGQLAIRKAGGTAGHNGLKSIRDGLGSAEFYRFRLGVGRPARGDVSSYVLGRFSPDEEARLNDLCAEAAVRLFAFLADPTSA